MESILFIQVNLHKSFLAATSLAQNFNAPNHSNKSYENKNKVALITEPYTPFKKLATLPLQTKAIAAYNENAPRAAIVYTNTLNITPLTQFLQRDYAVGILNLEGRKVLIVSLYLDILLPIKQDHLHKILRYAQTHQLELIVGADTNAHSTLYGNSTNQRGRDIEEIISSYSLKVLNNSRTPTFEAPRHTRWATSCIDVTLTARLKTTPQNWFVDTNYNGSDHNNIIFSLPVDIPNAERSRQWKKMDWNKYTSYLTKTNINIPDRITKKKVDNIVQKLYDKINHALDQSCPTTMDIKKNPTHWYNTDLKELNNKVTKAYKQYVKSNGTRERKVYIDLRNKYKYQCKKASKESWQTFKTETEDTKQMAFIAKLAQHSHKQEIGTILQDGIPTLPGEETSRALQKQHFPSSTVITHMKYDSESVNKESLDELHTQWINDTLIQTAIGQFQTKKSPGPDQLSPLTLTKLPPNIINLLKYIYKAMISLRYTPKLWREAKVIYIPKPDKVDYSSPRSYRPITLSNYMLKTLERLAVWKMDEKIKENPVHQRQHGFRSDRSTETAISETVNYIEKHLSRGDQCVGIFLDIKAAFDSISTDQIYKQLIAHGADHDLATWYRNMIENRQIQYEHMGETIKKRISIGFPQGGVASAKFWLIAFNPAVEIINKYEIWGNAFADDCGAILGGNNINEILATLNIMMDELLAWGKSCNLRFNPQKTVVIHFTKKREAPPYRMIIEDTAVPYSSNTKYLGVTLDSKLTWKPHINRKIAEAKGKIFALTNLVRQNWGPKPKLMKWAYTAIIRPALTYACVCWQHATDTKTIQKQINQVDRLAMLTFTRVHKSTPTKGLALIYDLMPLNIFLQMNSIKAYARQSQQMSLNWPQTASEEYARTLGSKP